MPQLHFYDSNTQLPLSGIYVKLQFVGHTQSCFTDHSGIIRLPPEYNNSLLISLHIPAANQTRTLSCILNSEVVNLLINFTPPSSLDTALAQMNLRPNAESVPPPFRPPNLHLYHRSSAAQADFQHAMGLPSPPPENSGMDAAPSGNNISPGWPRF